MNDTDTTYTPTSLGVIEGRIGRTKDVPVRLRFEPFGRPVVGIPGEGENRILYADVYLLRHRYGDDRPTLWLDANGIKYLLADGRYFRSGNQELADEFPEEASLGEHGHVLGREAPDGGGFIPVGVHVEVALPDQ